MTLGDCCHGTWDLGSHGEDGDEAPWQQGKLLLARGTSPLANAVTHQRRRSVHTRPDGRPWQRGADGGAVLLLPPPSTEAVLSG